MKITKILLLLTSVFIISCSYSNKKQLKQYTIGFYNVENLFDTIPNGSNDLEYTPKGKKKWNSFKYKNKINHISRVIKEFDINSKNNPPAIIGLAEIENQFVLNDLLNSEKIKKHNYKYVHYDSPDHRGIDVALIYREDVFSVTSAKIFPLIIYDKKSKDRIFTRDQLLVQGKLNGVDLNIIVNHWPSRYGGFKRSIPSRAAAAKLTKHISDSLFKENSNANIIIMGDLNDNPDEKSVTNILNAVGDEKDLTEKQLFNTSYALYKSGEGSLFYKKEPFLFDQIIVSKSLVSGVSKLKYNNFQIVKNKYLFEQKGRFKGKVFRTFGGKKYINGYSDHLPVFIKLTYLSS